MDQRHYTIQTYRLFRMQTFYRNKMFACFLDPTSVTNCRPEYEQRTLCGALVVTLVSSHVTAPYKLSFYYYYYY